MTNPVTLVTGYLAIGTAFASGVLTELSGSGYARQAVTLTYDPSANVIGLLSGVTFGPATGALAAGSFLAVYDSASGGNLLLAWPAATPAQVSGTSASVPANSNLGQFTSGLTALTNLPATVAAQKTVGTIGYGASQVTLYNGVAITISSAYALTVAGPNYTTASQAPVFPRNAIDGGDFTTNPWQRGTSFTGIAATLTYTADRFFAVGGASSSISVSSQASTAVAGFSTALQFGRANANSNTAAINLGQVLETADSIRFQGQQATLSTWMVAGALFSGGTVTAQVITGTGTNQSAASMVAGTWTGQAVAGTATWTPSTTAQRYQLLANIPANATQIGILFTYTPSGTAGATDFVQFLGIQLEEGAGASNFEHRDVQLELEIAQRYAFVAAEPAAGVVVASGMITSGTTIVYELTLPVQMRAAPTVTVATGTFKANIAGTATTTTVTTGATHTPNYLTVNASGSAMTAGQASLLQGGGGSGSIVASADL